MTSGVNYLAHCVAILGKSGSGKSTIVKRRLAKENPKRLVIWSPDEDIDNYKNLTGGLVVRTIPELIAVIKKPMFKVTFWCSMEDKTRRAQFNYFCELIFAVGNCTALFEELAGVTTPSFAPTAWKVLSTRSRKKGVLLYGTSQRPAQIDKDFLGNTSEIYIGALKYPNDRKACALATMQPLELINQLQPLEWVHVQDDQKPKTFTIKF